MSRPSLTSAQISKLNKTNILVAAAPDAVNLGTLLNQLISNLDNLHAYVVDFSSPGAESADAIEVAFQVKDSEGATIAEEVAVRLRVCLTKYGTAVPAAGIEEAGTPVGTIVQGGGNSGVTGDGSCEVIFKTDASGAGAVKVTCAAAGTLYLMAAPTFGGRPLDCSDVAELTFA